MVGCFVLIKSFAKADSANSDTLTSSLKSITPVRRFLPSCNISKVEETISFEILFSDLVTMSCILRSKGRISLP